MSNNSWEEHTTALTNIMLRLQGELRTVTEERDTLLKVRDGPTCRTVVAGKFLVTAEAPTVTVAVPINVNVSVVVGRSFCAWAVNATV